MRGVAGVQDLLEADDCRCSSGVGVARIQLAARRVLPTAQVLNFMLAGVLGGLQPTSRGHSMSCCVVYRFVVAR